MNGTFTTAFKSTSSGFWRFHLLAPIIISVICLNSVKGNDVTNAPAADVKKPAASPAKKISGVELYAIHCNRCHPERFPNEFNEAQCKTIMVHMRVRANLPAEQARAVMQYMQQEAGN
jgi:mono/diheme cytochrome c family protein